MVSKAYHHIRGNAIAFCQQPHHSRADVVQKQYLDSDLVFELVRQLQPNSSQLLQEGRHCQFMQLKLIRNKRQIALLLSVNSQGNPSNVVVLPHHKLLHDVEIVGTVSVQPINSCQETLLFER